MTIRAKTEFAVRRIKSGLSQRELAGRAKINHSTIANIEAGRAGTGAGTAKSICTALNADFDELFEIRK